MVMKENKVSQSLPGLAGVGSLGGLRKQSCPREAEGSGLGTSRSSALCQRIAQEGLPRLHLRKQGHFP